MWRRENEKTWNLNKALVQWFIVSSSDHCPFQCHEIWNKQLKNLNIPACPWIQNILLGINEVPDPPGEAARSMFPFASASSRVSEKKDTDKQHQRMVLLAWENQVKNSYTGIIGSVFALTNSLTLSSITTWWAKSSVIKDTQVYFLKKKIHRYNTTVEYPFFLKKRVNWHRTYLLYYIITVLICSFLDTLAFILQPQIGI